MPEATIKLSDADTKAAIAAAVVSVLTPEAMQDSLRVVLEKMMSPPEYSYGRKISPIQDLFEDAVKKRVTEEVDRLFAADDGFRAKIRQLVIDAMNGLFDNVALRELMVTKLSSAFAAALSGGR